DVLKYEDIENYFNTEQQESNKIEFKSYFNPEENQKEKLNGIIRTICGLLNSEGGLIIWGAPVGQILAGKNEKVFKGNLSPVEERITKDNFINRVSDSITPSPRNVHFHQLEKDGKFVYVIDVEKSVYSPHQFRNIYYMRIDGQTRPSPHYLIEALFRKVSYPNLEGYIRIDDIRIQNENYILTLSYLIFNKSKLQNEYEVYSRLFIYPGKFFTSLGTLRKYYTNEAHEMVFQNVKSTLFYNEPVIEQERVYIAIADLMESNSEVTVLFTFGGKQSPLMLSKYTLSFRNVNHSNPNSIISGMEENIYMHENSDKIDKSDEEKLRLILKR
ncbi:MAG: AlbA family DNA-binding domain-containing protein, partial [Ginsengibacter sp.]